MKRKTTLFLAAVVAAALAAGFLATSALAADAAKPPAPATASVLLTSTDVAAIGAALSNAGAACDLNVAIYCQLVPLRAAILAKLTAAENELAKPAAPEKKP